MKKRLIPYSRESLIKLYDEHGSIGKVAAYLSRSYSTVRYWYHRYEIEMQPSCMTVFQEIRNIPMSNTQKSVILGSILGDGTLRLAPHSKNSRLKLGHSERQLEYLKWKNELLRPFSREVKLDQAEKEKNFGGYKATSKNFYSFYTIAHPDVTSFYKRYYSNHKKIISEDVINELDLLALAIWFCDDGSVYVDKKNGGAIGTIATNSFSYNEQLILKEAFSKFFKGTIKIDKQGNKGRDDLLIRFYRTKYIKEFLEMISTILPKSIHYKLNLQRLGVEPPIILG